MISGASVVVVQTYTILTGGGSIAKDGVSSMLPTCTPKEKTIRRRKATRKQVNGKRRKRFQTAATTEFLGRVSEFIEHETHENIAAQEDTWNEQGLLIKEQQSAQRLTTLYAMLDRKRCVIQQLVDERRAHVESCQDASDVGQALQQRVAKKTKCWKLRSVILNSKY
ncbi:hypothetical protein ON010_g408 [Phytophthora cinnamomi]|nr:hypothetical protein ON010_g408 [Phytophthora cinnamomi]